jgi:uncharacterized protein YjbJ (UPF0337 family)
LSRATPLGTKARTARCTNIEQAEANTMNKDTLKGQFDQFIGAAKSQWGKLTDDDFMKVKGDLQMLKGAVQERYGLTLEEAKHQVDKWEASRPRDMTDRSDHDDHKDHKDHKHSK